MLTDRQHRERLALSAREQVLTRERLERDAAEPRRAKRLAASPAVKPNPKHTYSHQAVAEAFKTWSVLRENTQRASRAALEASLTSYALQPPERRYWR